MTIREIIKAAEAYIDDDIEEANAILAINEAQAKIGDLAFVQDTAVIPGGGPTVAGQWYELPDELLTIITVTHAHTGRPFNRYLKRGQQIQFHDSGVFNLLYRRMPRPITTTEGELELHPVFEPAIVTYLRAWVKLMEDEDSEDGMRLKQEFYNDADRAFRTLRKAERRGLQIPVERTPFAR